MAKSKLAKAKKKAWSAFSLYIRTKGSTGGMNICITCGRHYPVSGRGFIQAGHFIAGRHNAILFEERGVHPQCYGCNVAKKGNMVKYYKWMLENYGQKVIDELEQLDTTTVKYSVQDYIDIEKKYKQKLLDLSK